MIKRIVYLLMFAACNMLFAQEPIVAGHSFTMHSSILKEEREIAIQLPKNYNNSDFESGNYPVLYVLDGDFNFQYVAAIERFGTKFLYRPFPEMIVVGIKNTDRTRDFTPSNTVVEGKNGEKRFVTSGGADNFIKFLEEELQPHINSKYRTNGYNVLLGHSFGGLFSIYALLERPGLFQSYIVIDPSLWWDNKRVYTRAVNEWKTKDFRGKSLFVALAHESPDDAKDRLQHGSTIREFCQLVLDSDYGSNLRSDWKYYPEHDHGLVPVPATMDALRFLFEGIQLPVKEVPKHPELIKETYKEVSKKLDFDFKPDESLLYELIQYTRKTGEIENAKKIVDYSLGIYPDSKQLKAEKDTE